MQITESGYCHNRFICSMVFQKNLIVVFTVSAIHSRLLFDITASLGYTCRSYCDDTQKCNCDCFSELDTNYKYCDLSMPHYVLNLIVVTGIILIDRSS